MNKAYLLIGGNTGNRFANLENAVNHIKKECGKQLLISHIYETAAWGKRDQAAFLNQALLIETSLTPTQLLHAVLAIEAKMGRHRQEKYGPRIIDIDILFYNNAIINEPFLIIPHPALPQRRFALEPLGEIAPGYIHPVLKKSIKLLLEECPDPLEVEKLDN
ncbi:MAG: 2-amino-4-hydroxy-6-hydroxymethyldihydropteridine diphosphokinase [Chitinophagaceae bacterium]|nr:2-amino-4-hydroxy-6-hydroxymethyldihydropteridine diphosphokinase [Chitinophagaceae bacterium]